MKLVSDCGKRKQDGIFLLCIDREHDDDMEGRIYYFHNELTCEYYSIVSGLLQMDKLLDELESLKPSLRAAAFSWGISREREDDNIWSAAPGDIEEGRLATVVIEIYFRRNGSWQGELTWKDKKERFRSVLELIGLLGDVLILSLKKG